MLPWMILGGFFEFVPGFRILLVTFQSPTYCPNCGVNLQ